MKKYLITLLFIVACSLSATAQQKITLEEIWGGAFRTKGMDELNAMKNTNQYTVLNFNRSSRTTQIDLYDYATLNKVATLIDTKNHPELKSIDSYTFDKQEKKILIATQSNPIFKHSFTANYFVYDIAAKKLQKFTDKAIQEPTFSPDGNSVAYAFENNLYLTNLIIGITTKITK